jgi:ketosteroid isomerase-like protein
MDTRSVVTELYAAYRAGDVARVAALIGDDIEWIIHGPAHVFSFEGPRRGKAAVMETLGQIAARFELKRYEQEVIIVEGERAAVISSTSFLQRTTKRTLSLRLVNFLRVREGKIVEFREFSDTFDAVEQALGAPLIVPALPV